MVIDSPKTSANDVESYSTLVLNV